MIVHNYFEDSKVTDNIHIGDGCITQCVDKALFAWRYPHYLELKIRTASVVDGKDSVLDVDVIDGNDDANNTNISDRMIKIEVDMLPWRTSATLRIGILHSYQGSLAQTAGLAHQRL